MTLDTAWDYARRRMDELGHGDRYILRMRHFVLPPGQPVEIDARDQLFILIEPTDTITVESAFGLFDLSTDSTNELQYEHSGTITLTNNAPIIHHLRLLQIIPQPPHATDRSKV